MFITLTGTVTGQKYRINPEKISAMESKDGSSWIYTDRVVNNNTLVYNVKESLDEIEHKAINVRKRINKDSEATYHRRMSEQIRSEC